MHCSRCSSTLTEGARYCGHCGASTLAGGEGRRGYAVQPGESVRSFNVVTSVMPLASGEAPQTYRWALLAGMTVPLVLGVLGYLPMAFAAAAAVVPAVYVVYLYDVNQWEDQPWSVVLGAMAASAVLATAFTIGWHDHVLSSGSLASRGGGVDAKDLIVLGLVVPVGVWLLAQIGPLWLASRPRFDDLIDGLTFGVASGAVFAAAETVVANWAVITQGPLHIDNPDAGQWVTLLFTAALIKPIVYGSAIGIAGAGFSGLGPAYDGFGRGYARAALEALVLLIAYGVGVYLCDQVAGGAGTVLALLWAMLVAGAGLLRLRAILHDALLEAALEAAAVAEGSEVTTSSDSYCPTCEMPLIPSASFCVACGSAVRAGSKRARGPSRARPEVVAASTGASAEGAR